VLIVCLFTLYLIRYFEVGYMVMLMLAFMGALLLLIVLLIVWWLALLVCALHNAIAGPGRFLGLCAATFTGITPYIVYAYLPSMADRLFFEWQRPRYEAALADFAASPPATPPDKIFDHTGLDAFVVAQASDAYGFVWIADGAWGSSWLGVIHDPSGEAAMTGTGSRQYLWGTYLLRSRPLGDDWYLVLAD
jgi:hypothetical protein